jgi:hypothetical protein
MKLRLLALSLAVAGLASTAQAALIDRGNGMIYDTVLNVTWLQDANLAQSNNFGLVGNDSGGYPLVDVDGTMTQDTAKDWISLMNAASYKGYSDWRLPTTRPANGTAFGGFNADNYSGANDISYNIRSTRSELSYMFYVNLGGLGLKDTLGNTRATGSFGLLSGTGPFTNLARAAGSGGIYWTDVNIKNPVFGQQAFVFTNYSGYQLPLTLDNLTAYRAWAVRDGDVSAVPEASSVAMLLGGLGLVGFMARRRRAV